MWGEDDTFGGVEVVHRMVAAMPAAELAILPRSGHLPWIDAADPRRPGGHRLPRRA
jgi:pimeloyl-ACP methyl ester carboxylesterase